MTYIRYDAEYDVFGDDLCETANQDRGKLNCPRVSAKEVQIVNWQQYEP